MDGNQETRGKLENPLVISKLLGWEAERLVGKLVIWQESQLVTWIEGMCKQTILYGLECGKEDTKVDGVLSNGKWWITNNNIVFYMG